MSTTTKNLNLKLPEKTDSFKIEDFNTNFTALDTAIAERIKDNAIDGTIITNSQSKIPSSLAVSTALAKKADVEQGTIASNNDAWYSKDSGLTGKTMIGTYQLIGDYCILSATVQRISGWLVVYYSLPVAAVAPSAAIAISDVNYTIHTSFQKNISVLGINKADRAAMSDGELYFTLIYKYK